MVSYSFLMGKCEKRCLAVLYTEVLMSLFLGGRKEGKETEEASMLNMVVAARSDTLEELLGCICKSGPRLTKWIAMFVANS